MSSSVSSTSFSERLSLSSRKSTSYLQPSDSFLYKKGTTAAVTTVPPPEPSTSSSSATTGQCYRATNLWLRAVSLFRMGVPLGRHRGVGLRVWRSYDDTFVASEAVTWMVNTLREENRDLMGVGGVGGGGGVGNGNVTRDKIVLLLDKFLQAGVFQHAENNSAGGGGGGRMNMTIGGGGGGGGGGRFKDDRSLYRLCPESSDDDQQDEEEDQENDKENNTTSAVASATTTSNKSTMRGVYVTEIRCTPLSLPQVYALWEEAFRRRVNEVFGNIKPSLIPASLQPEKQTPPGALLKRNSEESVKTQKAVSSSPSDLTSLPPSWLNSAMRFLAHYPSWSLSPSSSSPMFGGGGGDSHHHLFPSSSSASFYPNMCGDVLRLVTEYYRTYDGIRDHLRFDEIRELFQDSLLPKNRPPPPPLKHMKPPYHRSRTTITNSKYNEVYVRAMSESTDALLSGLYSNQHHPPHPPEELFYATEFFGGGSPLTRVVSERDLRRSVTAIGSSSSGCYVNSCLTLSPCDLINHPKYAGVKRRLFLQKHNSLSLGDVTLCGTTHPHDFDNGSFNNDSVCGVASSSSGGGGGGDSSQLQLQQLLLVPRLRLLFLSYPFGVRRHLYAILKFIGAIARNNGLNLDVAATNKDIMLSTYCDLIFGSPPQPPHQYQSSGLLYVDDPYLSLYREGLLWRLVEEVESLFAPDDALRNYVSDELQQKQVQRVKVWRGMRDEEGGDVYCAKVSVEEYDEQTYALRNKGLRDLLDAILLKDDNKAKRKLLKKFRSEYPHIYAEKFDTSSSSSSNDVTLPAATNATATATAASPGKKKAAAGANEKKGSSSRGVRKVLGVL